MLKRVALILSAVAVATNAFAAQTKQPPPAPKAETKSEAPAAKPAPEPPALPVNIRIEVSITDQSGTSPAAKKVVTMIASDRQSTNVRSSASVPVKSNPFGSGPNVPTNFTYKTVQINVDARPAIV